MRINPSNGPDSFSAPGLWVRAFLCGALYLGCAALSFGLSVPNSWYLTFWLPSGLLTGIYILSPLRVSVAATLVCTAMDLVYDTPHGTLLSVSAVTMAANIGESALGAWLFRRFVSRVAGLTTLRQFLGLVLFSAAIGPVLGATLGNLITFIVPTPEPYWVAWRDWWVSDSMGLVVLTPFIVSWFSGERLRTLPARRLAEGLLILCLMLGAAWLILVGGGGIQSTKIVLLFPFIVWMGIRFGVRGATLTVLLLAVDMTFLVFRHKSGLSKEQIASGTYLTTLNIFPIVASVMGLVPAFAIAERDSSAARLAESESRNRNFIENASVGIYRSSMDGVFLMANPAMLRIIGYDSFEALAAVDFNRPEIRRDYPRDEFMRRIREEGVLTGWETSFLRSDGTRRYVSESATLVRDSGGNPLYYEGVVEDITARRTAEQALRESEERFRTLNSASFEGIVITDGGLIVDLNEQVCALLGRSREELVGREAIEFVSPEAREAVGLAMREGRTAPYQLVLVRKDGTSFRAEALPREVRSGDRILRMTALRDLTERLRQEQRQKAMEEQMRQMQKMEALGTLAGGIAHGFNNILTGILGNLQIAEMDFGSDHPGIASIKAAEQATKRARDLVSSILSFSRSTRENRKTGSLAPTLKEAVELLRAGLPGKIEIRLELDPQCPEVEFDSGQIHEAIMNLGTNSAQAMPGSAGLIRISLDRVAPRGEFLERHPQVRPEHTVCIRVSDNGTGIAPEALDRIFEPFFTTKGVGKGTGLGLAIVHTVMAGHGGAIVVESAPGSGTTFSLFFRPAAVPEAARPQAPRLSSGAGLEPFGNGRRILVVDDEESVLTVASGILRRVGFRTSSYLQPSDALAAFRAAPEDYSLVVSDVSMPSMTGTELARLILSIRPGMPIILVSGNFKLESRGDPLSASLVSILQKPFGAGDLARTVRELIK